MTNPKTKTHAERLADLSRRAHELTEQITQTQAELARVEAALAQAGGR